MADTPLQIYQRRLRELLASIDRGNADLQSIHAELSRGIIDELRKQGTANTNTVKLQAQFDRAFERTLPKRARIVRERIEEGAKTGRKTAQETLRVAFGEKTTRGQVRATTGAMREAGERIAGRVTVDGVSLGKRMRRVDKDVSAEMARAVQAGIRQQQGILGAARKIQRLDPRSAELPGYLQQLESAARAGDNAAVKKLAEQYAGRLAKMGEVQIGGAAKASKYSLRAATKRFVAGVQKAGADGVDGVVKKYVEERLAWRANVIARSESVEAMRQSYVEQAKNKSGVVCFEWRLSGRHGSHVHGSREDVCDILAHQNAYGLGPGRYPAEHVPKLPHPLCLCSCVTVVDRRHFERSEEERGEVPAEMRDAKSPDAIGWLRQNDAAAARILGPTRHELLLRGRNVLDAQGRPRLVRDLLSERVAAE